MDKASDELDKSAQLTDKAAVNAETEGKADARTANPEIVTHEVADAAANMVNKVEAAIKQLMMALDELKKLLPELSYVKGLSEQVADNTPLPPEPAVPPPVLQGNERQFGTRQPSLLRRLNQQSTYAAPQRSRLQYRGLARR